MLVIERLPDESLSLELPDCRTIRVVITQVKGDRVKIGVEAPRDIKITRSGYSMLPKTNPVAEREE